YKIMHHRVRRSAAKVENELMRRDMMRIYRRTLLTSGAAVVAATTFTCARQLFARDQIDPAIQERLDTVLRNATRRGDFPGVVTAITDRNNTINDGAFGARGL